MPLACGAQICMPESLLTILDSQCNVVLIVNNKGVFPFRAAQKPTPANLDLGHLANI